MRDAPFTLEEHEQHIRAAERERCAKIAERVANANLSSDGEWTPQSSVAQSIANMIRSDSF